MFKKLTDLAYKRTGWQAAGFYLAYLVLGILLSGLLGGISGMFVGAERAEYSGAVVGGTAVVFFTIGLALGILQKKKLLGNFGCLLLVLFAGLLALFLGGLGGLIPVAFLTTRKPRK
ncbi:MAG: hypothetical protein LBD99_04405 [Candidatus Margulisbacteria bacterium]|jgi:hypothetical protein|nr:hypothetical protein [Candidatus Margulisiibacteriota bacterium]